MFNPQQRYFPTVDVFKLLNFETDRIDNVKNLPDTYITNVGIKPARIYIRPIYDRWNQNFHLLIAKGGAVFDLTSIVQRVKMDQGERNVVFVGETFIDDTKYVLLRKRGLYFRELEEEPLPNTDPDSEPPVGEVKETPSKSTKAKSKKD
jgi:hypothetical protein